MAVAAPVAERAALAASALAGDEEALGGLLAIHQQAAYNVAFRLLGREADAYDAVQEAFLLALRAIRGEGASPREIDRFEPWLLKVVTNAALGQLRRRPRVAPLSVDELVEALPAPERGEPAREAERREARGDVLRALLALPDAQRAALTLREYQGLSYDEIAAALGVSRAAVETLLFRARRGFRAAYEGLAAAPQLIGCPELAPLLSAMIDNELEASALMELSGHVARCLCCRHELDQLRRTRRLHALIPLVAAPAGLGCAAMASSVAAAASSQAAPVASTLLGGALAAKLAGLTAANVAAAVAVGFGLVVVATPHLGNEVAVVSESVSNGGVIASVGSDVPRSSEGTVVVQARMPGGSPLDTAPSGSMILVDVSVGIPTAADPDLAATDAEASLPIAPAAMAHVSAETETIGGLPVQSPTAMALVSAEADASGALPVESPSFENQAGDSATGLTRSEQIADQPGQLPLGQLGEVVAAQVEVAAGAVDQAVEQLVEPLEATAIDELEPAAGLVREAVEEVAQALGSVTATLAAEAIGALPVQSPSLETQARDSASGWTRSEQIADQPGQLPLGQLGEVVVAQVEVATGPVDQSVEHLVEPLQATAIDELEQAAGLVREAVEEVAQPVGPLTATLAAEAIGALPVQSPSLENQARDSASSWTRSEPIAEQPAQVPLGQLGEVVVAQVEAAAGAVDQAVEQLVEPLEATVMDELEQAVGLVREAVEEVAQALGPLTATLATEVVGALPVPSPSLENQARDSASGWTRSEPIADQPGQLPLEQLGEVVVAQVEQPGQVPLGQLGEILVAQVEVATGAVDQAGELVEPLQVTAIDELEQAAGLVREVVEELAEPLVPVTATQAASTVTRVESAAAVLSAASQGLAESLDNVPGGIEAEPQPREAPRMEPTAVLSAASQELAKPPEDAPGTQEAEPQSASDLLAEALPQPLEAPRVEPAAVLSAASQELAESLEDVPGSYEAKPRPASDLLAEAPPQPKDVSIADPAAVLSAASQEPAESLEDVPGGIEAEPQPASDLLAEALPEPLEVARSEPSAVLSGTSKEFAESLEDASGGIEAEPQPASDPLAEAPAQLLEASLPESELIGSVPEQPADELVTQSALSEEPAQAPMLGTSTTTALETSPESSGGTTAVSVSTAPAPSEPSTVSGSTAPAPSEPSTVSVSTAPAPSEPSTMSVSTAPAPSDPSTMSVSTAPAPSEPSTVSVSTAPAPSESSTMSVSTAPASSDPSTVSVSTAPAPSEPSTVSVSTAPAPSSTSTVSVPTAPAPSSTSTSSVQSSGQVQSVGSAVSAPSNDQVKSDSSAASAPSTDTSKTTSATAKLPRK